MVRRDDTHIARTRQQKILQTMDRFHGDSGLGVATLASAIRKDHSEEVSFI